jgi:uncharacterized LabA/DUF88 family protein
MRVRRIAILIDGGFFLKRLPRLVDQQHCSTPEAAADSARMLCKRHVQHLIKEPESARPSKWLDHVYRLFYYDATPYTGIAHHPILNQQIQFARTREAAFREQLFAQLRRKRKFALRLGKVTREDGWLLKNSGVSKKLLRTRNFLDYFERLAAAHESGSELPQLDADELVQFKNMVSGWSDVETSDIRLGLRQKGVDMRIGVDIASITLKQQADTIILVTGDSDFVPAAKVARREGVEFLLDPLWQSVNDDLHEHVDGIVSGIRKPGGGPSNIEDSQEKNDADD